MVNSTCVLQQNYTISGSCPSDMFQCKKKKDCISRDKLCNGENDCGDRSDELPLPEGPCKNKICDNSSFICDGTNCISKNWLCDGQIDCKDGTDENPKYCKEKCSSGQFMCKLSRRCIPNGWKCDGNIDCGKDDNSDEQNCS